MYEKSLEQLIDAVIADGVITDQERKVVYKKAKSLGIDQEEIEVYLEGRLDAFTNKTAPKSNKYGSIRTCPNCGANIGAFAAKCPDCGHEISNVTGNSSVKELQRQLDSIDKESKSAISSQLLSSFGIGASFNRKIQLIKNFAIPNTKEDIIEFALLCASNLSTTSSNQADLELRKAWESKATQVENKAKMLFPNDKDVLVAITHLTKERKSFFKSNQKAITITLILVVTGILFFALAYFVIHSSEETQKYAVERIHEIEALPVPNNDNYKECSRKFSQIHWTESKSSQEYKAFVDAQIAYRDLLIIAYREAGVSEDLIPNYLKEIGSDPIIDKTESSNKEDSTNQELANPD